MEKCCFHMLKALIPGAEGPSAGQSFVCSCQKSQEVGETVFSAAKGWERLLLVSGRMEGRSALYLQKQAITATAILTCVGENASRSSQELRIPTALHQTHRHSGTGVKLILLFKQPVNFTLESMKTPNVSLTSTPRRDFQSHALAIVLKSPVSQPGAG